MRLKEINLDIKDLSKTGIMEPGASYVIVLSEGRAKMAELPKHAETTIKTFKGKVTRVNWDEGEPF